mmetsp:Transcript_26043/g.42339  ORF Transcript_26043/g.42339 Transcript_26043/m.42339 type:complete len:110 (+) Transcript_26043:198-527(+)
MSRKRSAVSAKMAMFLANATRTIKEASVIRCATFLKTYFGKICASDGGKLVTVASTDAKTDMLDARTIGSESWRSEVTKGTIRWSRMSSEENNAILCINFKATNFDDVR